METSPMHFSGLFHDSAHAQNRLGINHGKLAEAIRVLQQPYLEPGTAQMGTEPTLIELLEQKHGLDVFISVGEKRVVGNPVDPFICVALGKDGQPIERTRQEIELSQLTPVSMIRALHQSLCALVSPVTISIESLARLLREIT